MTNTKDLTTKERMENKVSNFGDVTAYIRDCPDQTVPVDIAKRLYLIARRERTIKALKEEISALKDDEEFKAWTERGKGVVMLSTTNGFTAKVDIMDNYGDLLSAKAGKEGEKTMAKITANLEERGLDSKEFWSKVTESYQSKYGEDSSLLTEKREIISCVLDTKGLTSHYKKVYPTSHKDRQTIDECFKGDYEHTSLRFY